jgi:hypothetical protein
VLLEDHLLERLAGALVRQHPRKPLAEMPSAILAVQLAAL